jgi:hypothetical protein
LFTGLLKNLQGEKKFEVYTIPKKAEALILTDQEILQVEKHKTKRLKNVCRRQNKAAWVWDPVQRIVKFRENVVRARTTNGTLVKVLHLEAKAEAKAKAEANAKAEAKAIAEAEADGLDESRKEEEEMVLLQQLGVSKFAMWQSKYSYTQ